MWKYCTGDSTGMRARYRPHLVKESLLQYEMRRLSMYLASSEDTQKLVPDVVLRERSLFSSQETDQRERDIGR